MAIAPPSLGSVAGFFFIPRMIPAARRELGYTGRVGGQRHSTLWLPIRLVFGFGLLAPIPGADGWNGGQLTAVWVAGQGSKIASSVWTAFTSKIASGEGAIVVPPMSSPIESVVGTLLTIETCAQAQNTLAAKLGDPDYIKVTVGRQIRPSTFGGQYAVERSYDGATYLPRKACGAIKFMPPENLDYAGEQQMVAALFLRPILMVFSLVVGLQIFNSVMWLWNLLFLPNMMASAASGNTMGFVVGVIYVVVYCASVYAFANASFKAIDYLPNQVLRWIGGQVMHDMDNSAMIERASQQAGQGVGEGQKSLMKSAQGDESKSPAGRGATGEKNGDSITQSMLPNPDQRGIR